MARLHESLMHVVAIWAAFILNKGLLANDDDQGGIDVEEWNSTKEGDYVVPLVITPIQMPMDTEEHYIDESSEDDDKPIKLPQKKIYTGSFEQHIGENIYSKSANEGRRQGEPMILPQKEIFTGSFDDSTGGDASSKSNGGETRPAEDLVVGEEGEDIGWSDADDDDLDRDDEDHNWEEAYQERWREEPEDLWMHPDYEYWESSEFPNYIYLGDHDDDIWHTYEEGDEELIFSNQEPDTIFWEDEKEMDEDDEVTGDENAQSRGQKSADL